MTEDPKLDKFVRALELANVDSITAEELGETVQVIAAAMGRVKDECDSSYEEIHSTVSHEIDRVDSRIDATETSILKSKQEVDKKLREFELPSGRDGHDGKDGKDGVGKDGRDGKDGVDGSPDTPNQVVEKINSSGLLIKKERIEGLIDLIGNVFASAVPITTNFFNGLRAKNLTINGATAVQRGDTVFLTVSGSGIVQTIVAGTGISVNSTDPANPIVSTTGSGSFTVLVPSSGVVNGINRTFTFATAPSVIVLDNSTVMNKQNITPDLTVNWTGTTTVTLTQAPTFNIFAY